MVASNHAKQSRSKFLIETHSAKNAIAAARIAGTLEGQGFKTLIIKPSGSNPFFSVTGGKRRKR